MSPFDAIATVKPNGDGTYTACRYGIGYGQKGYWANELFASLDEAKDALEKRLSDLRKIYSDPGYQWSGKYIEEEIAVSPTCDLICKFRFTNLLKSGKKGKTVHNIQMYKINVDEKRLNELSEALRTVIK